MRSTRGRKRAPSSTRSLRTDRDGDASSDGQSSMPGEATYSMRNGTLMHEPSSARRRRPFTAARRSEVASVRRVGACEKCRKKKTACKHVLDEVNLSTSPSASVHSPRSDVNFEDSHPDLHLKNIDTERLHPDVGRRQFFPSGIEPRDLADLMLGAIPTPAAHSDRIALEMDDFDTTFAVDLLTPTNFDQSYPGSGWTAYQPDAASEPELQTSEPSSRSDNTHFSSLSPPSSNASDNDSMLTLQNSLQSFHCHVSGCDLNHGFANLTNLKRHQESRHADLYQPMITFTCSVNGCPRQRRPFVRKDKLLEHVRLTHPDELQERKGLHDFESGDLDPLRLGKKHQVEQYLAGEYLAGMEIDNDLIAFPIRNRLPGENKPFLHRNGKITTSSRGHDRVMKPPRHRRPSVSSRTADGLTEMLQSSEAPVSNLHMEWHNTGALSHRTAVSNMMPHRTAAPARNLEVQWTNSHNPLQNTTVTDPFGMTYSVAQGSLSTPENGPIPDMYGDLTLQMYGQTYGPPPSDPLFLSSSFLSDPVTMPRTFPAEPDFANPNEFQNEYPAMPDPFLQMPSTSESLHGFGSGYLSTSSTMPPQQELINLDEFQNGYSAPQAQRRPPLQTPAIRVHPVIINEDAYPNPYASLLAPSLIAASSLLGPFDPSSTDSYSSQQNWGMVDPSLGARTSQFEMQNDSVHGESSMRDGSLEEAISISENWDMMSHSTPYDESSLASMNQAMQYENSRSATPPMELGGPRSSSSEASPFTMVETPTVVSDRRFKNLSIQPTVDELSDKEGVYFYR